MRTALWPPNSLGLAVHSSAKKNSLPKADYFSGGRGGTRTLKPYRQRILSPQRIPIPPLARSLVRINYNREASF
jgi:hypothetical protein